MSKRDDRPAWVRERDEVNQTMGTFDSETPLNRWARATVIVGGTVVALGLAVAWDVGLFIAVWKALFG